MARAASLRQMTIAVFEDTGRALERGLRPRIPSLPRDPFLRLCVERAAQRDPNVRRAYNIALRRAETAKQVETPTLRRA